LREIKKAAGIAPLQPSTLATFLSWGSRRELVVPTAAAKVGNYLVLFSFAGDAGPEFFREFFSGPDNEATTMPSGQNFFLFQSFSTTFSSQFSNFSPVI